MGHPSLPSLDELRRAEVAYAAAFADREERPYGVLYHCADLPQATECNYAIVTDRCADAMAVVGDVVRFYEGLGLVPRINGMLCRGQLAQLRPALEAHGFTVVDRTDRRPSWLLQVGPSRVHPNPELAVRPVREIGEAVAGLIADEGEFPWTVDVIRRRMRSDAFHLLVGYVGDDPVAMASFTCFAGLTRVDDVVTRERYRRRGYARTVMHELVALHARLCDTRLYLWVTNPVARRVYEDAGLAEQPVDAEFWTAWKAGNAQSGRGSRSGLSAEAEE